MSDLTATAGEQILLDFGPITRPDTAGVQQPINLRAVGTKLRFMAKRSKTDLDAAAEIDKNYAVAAGPAFTQNGIYVPDTALDNTGYVQIDPSETADILIALYLEWELWLEEASGRKTLIDYGPLKIQAATLRGAV